MIDRLTSDPDGIALMLIVAVIGLVLLLGALFIERLVEPRHQRTHASRAERGRRAQANSHRPLPRPQWTPPSGWVHDR